jgi:RNA polymerase sigma-32 factor
MNKGLITNTHQLVPVGSLEAYINWTQSIPVLKPEEEKRLLDKIFCQGDHRAIKELVVSHLRFVVYVSRSYLGYGLSHADIIQEGNIGLMKAIKRFDPKVGVRLVSFAVYWIKSEIQEYILKNWRMVKVATTKAQRKLFFKLRSYMKNQGAFTKEDVSHIASALNVPEREVRTMESRLSSYEASFDGDNTEEDETKAFAPAQYLTAPASQSPEQSAITSDQKQIRQWALERALEGLDERSRDIIQQRWLDEQNKATLHELAARYNVSAERVRQLEKMALAKLKKSMVSSPL